MALDFHIPGRPKSTEPKQLAELAKRIHHPSVVRTGLTTTEEGNWALLVIVKPNTSTPILAIEKMALGFPVIYLDDDNRIVRARPAYPSLGE